MDTAMAMATDMVIMARNQSKRRKGKHRRQKKLWWKRILIGILPYFVYLGLHTLYKKLHAEDNQILDTIALGVSGFAGAFINTALVMSLIYFCFGKSYAAVKGISYETLYSVILGVVAVNGVLEAIVATIVTAVVCKVLLRVLKRNVLS